MVSLHLLLDQIIIFIIRIKFLLLLTDRVYIFLFDSLENASGS